MRLLDIAWLAGLLEGEGCFYARPRTGRTTHSISIVLNMTDRDVVARAADMFGVPLRGPYGPYKHNKKPLWRVDVLGTRAARWIMTLYPFMSHRRKVKMRELLAYWKTQPLPSRIAA